MRRYLYRVLVNGNPVRHYQSKSAALHRAREMSLRPGWHDATVTVEKSVPFSFVREDGGVTVSAVYRAGVAL